MLRLRTAQRYPFPRHWVSLCSSVSSPPVRRHASSASSSAPLIFRVSEGNRKEKKLFLKRSKCVGEYEDINAYIARHKDQLTKQDVVAMVLESSKRKVRITRLSDITVAFKNSAHLYDANALSVLVCGLQLYTAADLPARNLLAAICDRLERRVPATDPSTVTSHLLKWSPGECANVLYGLKGMSSTVTEVQRLLQLLPRHSLPITTHTKVTDKMLAKGLYGLQKMTSDQECTRQILSFYLCYLTSYQGQVGEQALSHCLFGLQGCSSDHAEVRQVLTALVALIPRGTGSGAGLALQPRSVGAALFGLQRMSNSHAEVEEVVERVTNMALRGVACSRAAAGGGVRGGGEDKGYGAYTLGSVFLGLQQMHPHSSAVRRLLVMLREQLESCDPTSFNELAFANMFYGLQSMGSEVPEVRQLLRVLTEKLAMWTKLGVSSGPSSPTHQMSLRGIASCLFGLKQMSDSHAEVTKGAMWILREQLVIFASRRSKQALMLSCGTTGPKVQREAADTDDVLNSKVVSLASGVFRNMHSGNGEVRRMLQTQAAVWTALSYSGMTTPSHKNHKKRQSSQKGGDSAGSVSFQWDEQAVGNVLYNLRNMSNEYEEVRNMLGVVWTQGLHHRATAARGRGEGKQGRRGGDDGVFPALSLSRCLYGLRSMTPEHDTASGTLSMIIETLTAELERHLPSASTSFTSKEEGTVKRKRGAAGANISSDSGSHCLMTAQLMCMALYGLQGCTNRHASVNRLVGMSADILLQRPYSADMDVLTLSNGILGMQCMSNQSVEVRRLLRAVSRHLAVCDLSLSASGEQQRITDIGTATGNFLYGVQAMSMTTYDDDNDELAALLTLIHCQLVQPFATHFAIDSIQRSVYGIASLLDNSVVSSTSAPMSPLLNITEVLLRRIFSVLSIDVDDTVKGKHTDIKNIYTTACTQFDIFREIVPLYQALSLLKESLQTCQQKQQKHPSADSFLLQINRVACTLEHLLLHLRPALPHSDGDYNSSSATEKIFYDYVKRHVQQNNKQHKISVQLNEIVDGFSTDILVRGHSSANASSQILMNIEIDGPSHRFPRKKRFMDLRDSFLRRTQGFTTRRVDVQGKGYEGSKLETTLKALMREVDSMVECPPRRH